MRNEDILVVDDFSEVIDQVIQSAHNSGFGTWAPNKGYVGSSVYEGMNFWGEHAVFLKALCEVTGSIVLPNSMFFRATNPGMEQAYIHSDRETGNWTCVVYLSEHDEEYGTAFYKHLPTGLEEMPSFEEIKETPEFEQLKTHMIERTDGVWEQTGFVPGKKNRAVIFKAPLFHSRFPLDGLGTDSSNARLVWVSHFYKLDQYGNLY